MQRNVLTTLSAALLVASAAAAADEAGSLASALTSGKAGIAVRARYEHVDQDVFSENANALNARLRLNYRTGTWNSLSAFAEFDHVVHVLDDFNSGGGTSPGKTRFPVVADPDGADLNQLFLDYRFDDTLSARIGRQRILLDNQRFVGGVGWRQNEQTFDGVTLISEAVSNVTLSYSYIAHVRRIFGDDVPAGKNGVDVHLMNAKYSINDQWSVSPYFYAIDNDDIASFSTHTLGASLTGRVKAGDGSVALYAEFATQDDAGNNPASYDAQYYHLGATWALNERFSLGVDIESLGGSTTAGEAFRTPLATLHAFQGWADMFATTPDGGVDDVFATVKYKAGRWNLAAIYHDFSSESGSIDYGTEFDVSAATKISDNYGILIKGAFFNSDTAAMTDTSKFWVMFTANY